MHDDVRLELVQHEAEVLMLAQVCLSRILFL